MIKCIANNGVLLGLVTKDDNGRFKSIMAEESGFEDK